MATNHKCKKCNKILKCSSGLISHERNCDGTGTNLDKKKIKKNAQICPLCGYEIKQHFEKHLKTCNGKGPKRARFKNRGQGWLKGKTYIEVYGKSKAKEVKRKIADKNKGKGIKHSLETKKKISNSLKKAHAERRANKWKPKDSYPEKFFKKFLIQQGYKENKDFYREFPFGRYKADFYFPKLRLVIEIDGSQHYRYDFIKRNDKRKDIYLENLNLEVLRISWRVLFHDSKRILETVKKMLKRKKIKKIDITIFNKTQLNKLNKLETVQKHLHKQTLRKKLRKKEEIEKKN